MHLRRTTFPLLALLATLCVLTAPLAAEVVLHEKTLAIVPGGVFDLETDSGAVKIRGTSRSDVHVLITAKDNDVAERYAVSFEERGGRAIVRVESRDGVPRRWFRWGADLEFAIEVPRNSSLEVETSGGRIEVGQIDGSADLGTSGGGIALDAIFGPVDAKTSGGPISASDLGASADLTTSGGSISVASVAGELRAKTSGGSITIEEAAGHVDAKTSGGSITANFSAGNDAGGSLVTSGGGIKAYVDESVGFDLDASTSGGGVTVDLPVTARGKISRRAVRGTINGGGAELRLRTSGGGVTVRPR